jgi:hypothetical protein
VKSVSSQLILDVIFCNDTAWRRAASWQARTLIYPDYSRPIFLFLAFFFLWIRARFFVSAAGSDFR